MRLTTITIALSLLAGCTTLPEPDCQVRAGTAIPEGSAAAPLGGGSFAGAGAAASMVGECPENFRTFARRGGAVVCYGEREWCEAALQNQPVELTPAQLREMVNGRR